MADRFPLILNTSTNQIQEIPSGDSLDLTGSGIANAGIITAGNVTIGAATTDLIVNGNARVTGILTIGTGSLTLDGPNNLVNVGTALTLGHTQGLQFHTQNLHSAGFEVNQINVSGASTMGDDVTFNGASSKNMVWDSSDGDLEFADNARLKFGNGDDFFLYHNGSHSYIKNSTNYLYYLATQHHFKNAANNELQARFQENGPVELYHDNTKRFETTTSGVTVTGDGTFTGNVSIGGTLTYEDVTNIDSVGIVTARAGINATGGNITLGDSSNGSSDDVLIFGAGSDLKIYHDSNHSYIQNATGDLFIKSNADDLVLQAADDVLIRPQNGQNGIKVIGSGAIELYHSNAKKFETTSSGVTITGSANVSTVVATSSLNSNGSINLNSDSGYLNIGTSNDLQLFHNGVNSYIQDNGTGALYIGSGNTSGAGVFIRGKHGEESIICNSNGSVDIYYDNSKKLETTSEGAKITTTASNIAATLEIEATNGGQPTLRLKASKSGTNRASRIDFLNQDSTSPKWTLISDFDQNGTNDFRLVDTNQATGNAIRALTNGGVELFYDNNKKLETSTSGVTVTGNVTASSYGSLGNYSGSFGRIRVGADVYGNTIKTQGDNNLNITVPHSVYFNTDANSNGSDAGTARLRIYSGGIVPTSNNSIDLGTSSIRWRNIFTHNLELNHSSSSTNTTGYAVQRVWTPGTISAGNVYKCGQWYEGEGAVQLYISVRSETGGHSGSATYLFQGGYAMNGNNGTQRLLPMASGRGHGDGADTGMNSNAWEVLIDQINGYTYALYIHVPSGRTSKLIQVSVTEMNRGNTFTDFSSTVAYSSISASVLANDPITSLQNSHAQVVRQHTLPAFRVGRGGSDQNVGTGDAILFNYTSGSSNYFNQGTHYNPSTGRFTAPYAGVYHFHALIIFEQVPDNTDMTDSWDFYLNSSQLAYSARRAKYRADYTGTSGYYTDPGTITIYMNKDDYIWIRNKYASKVIHSNPNYCYFCGHFCG